jgi:hypothetical protein
METIAQALRRIPFFAGCSDDVLTTLELRPPHQAALEDNLLLMDTLKRGSNELRSGSMTLQNPICHGIPIRVYCT